MDRQNEIYKRLIESTQPWVLDRVKAAAWIKDGKPEWMYGTHQDITERKLAEELLAAERERPAVIRHF